MKQNIIFLNYLKNLIILKKKKKLLLFKNKKKNIFIQIENFKINKNTGTLTSKNKPLNNNFIKKINFLIKIINSFYLEKFNFNGKGFKIKKLKTICFFLFNKSHKTYLIEKKNKIKKISKNSYVVIFKDLKKKITNKIKKIFPINKFTKKGIRKSEQIINIKKK